MGGRLDTMHEKTATFLAKIDEFAANLDADEQAMLAVLVGEEVSGFGFTQPWPGIATMLNPLKIGAIEGPIESISGTDLGSGRREKDQGLTWSDVQIKGISGTDLGSSR